MSSSPPSPSFLSRFWPTLLPLLAALGIPATAAYAFLTKNTVFALGLGLLYEVAVIVLGFASKVWERLEDSWAERAALLFDHWIQSIISRYRKHYYRYLHYQHRDLDVKGLNTLGPHSLELDQVFVELKIHTISPQQANPNPIQVPQALREGSHSIWDYLASISLSKQHLVIIGPPGSGKTTLLKHVTLSLATNRIRYHQHYHAKMPQTLPILLFLRDHTQTIKEQADFSLVDAVHDHLKKWEMLLPPPGWFKKQLTMGRCLVMLDGLDEVADPEVRHATVNWVERQMVAWSRNRFLITSRPFGYRDNPLSGVTVLEVRPFTVGQVVQFIQGWYLANEMMSKQKDDPGVRMRAKDESRELLQQLRSKPALFDLTVNPLLLTMITTVHRYGGRKLPDNRVALYGEICEVFLGKRQLARGRVLELTPAQMQLVLEPLAYNMMVKGTRDIVLEEVRIIIAEPLARVSALMTPEEFLRLVENASGLLLEREDGVYSFAHLTFQEYFATSYMRKKQMGQMLVAHIGDTWWQETIRLYSAMADASPIISACLMGDHPSTIVIELAIDCDKEALEVQPELRTQLEMLLKQGVEDLNPERQHVFANALLSRRCRQMIHLIDETYIDTSLITHAEYQIFLDSKRALGQYLQPDHWTLYRFPLGQGNDPALGVRPSDALAFCSWLTERESGPWIYRLPDSCELKKVAGTSMQNLLPLGTGFWLKDGKGFEWAREPLLIPKYVLNDLVDHIFTSNLARSHVRVLFRNHDLTSMFAHSLISNFYFLRERGSDYGALVLRARELARNYDLALARTSESDLIRASACSNVRNLALNLARTRKNYANKRENDVTQQLIDNLLNIYIDLAVLEKRIQGKLPTCEGILIVRERKIEATSYAFSWRK